ncbi:ead/Ea22-like family protein [Citrobacter freundii]|nr:ead/Ea22-like family protein [Citrobacter freundii]MEB0340309.1 ead/Ea22-like family protein [Citrobacter freundii]MEB0370819.1 ead/Ea22-like family protein [Citrobacter freundii]MEB0375113.1 ead/Ea22-like family protein [Citrobacter freundii]
MLRSVSDTSDAWHDEASPEAVLALLDELEAAEKCIAELDTRTVTIKLPADYRNGQHSPCNVLQC